MIMISYDHDENLIIIFANNIVYEDVNIDVVLVKS
jgi:hypothetical protein